MTEDKCVVVGMQTSGPCNKSIAQLASHCLGLMLLGPEFPRFYFAFSVDGFHILVSTDTRGTYLS